MKKIQYTMFAIVLGIILFFLIIYFGKKDKEQIETVLENMKFKFSGIVTDKKELYSATGLIYVDVKETTIQSYDIRGKSSLYNCVIKNNKAEIIETIYKIDIGDSIVVDGYNRTNTLYRKGKKIDQWNIWIGDYKPFYNGIKKYHKIK